MKSSKEKETSKKISNLDISNRGDSPHSPKKKEIVKTIEKLGYAVSMRKISSITRINYNTVKKYVLELVRRGFLVREFQGHYISAKNVISFSSSMVGRDDNGLCSPELRVHCLRLWFPYIGLSFRDPWSKNFGEVKVSFQVFKKGSALVFVDCKDPYSLDYGAFGLLIGYVQRELNCESLDFEEISVKSFELNRDFDSIRIDGIQAVTLKAFDGSFRRIYNKRNGLRDEVKIVRSRPLKELLAVFQGGVSTYNILQLLFLNFQKIDEYIETHKSQNRLMSDMVSMLKRHMEDHYGR